MKKMILRAAQIVGALVVMFAALVALHAIPELLIKGLSFLREWIGGVGAVLLFVAVIALVVAWVMERRARRS